MIRKPLATTLAITAIVATLLLAPTLSSCDKDDKGRDCTLQLAATANTDGLVVYSVMVTSGTGSAKSITYRADTKDITVDNPTLPFHVTIDKKQGENISITAQVHTDGGEVTASYTFSDADGIDPQVEAQSCKD